MVFFDVWKRVFWVSNIYFFFWIFRWWFWSSCKYINVLEERHRGLLGRSFWNCSVLINRCCFLHLILHHFHHLYIIYTSFIHHLYIIYASFIRHLYVIYTSILNHPHIFHTFYECTRGHAIFFSDEYLQHVPYIKLRASLSLTKKFAIIVAKSIGGPMGSGDTPNCM